MTILVFTAQLNGTVNYIPFPIIHFIIFFLSYVCLTMQNLFMVTFRLIMLIRPMNLQTVYSIRFGLSSTFFVCDWTIYSYNISTLYGLTTHSFRSSIMPKYSTTLSFVFTSILNTIKKI